MRIGYFGSPEISAVLLKRLLRDAHIYGEVVFVVSNPDRAKGRSHQLVPTPVSTVVLELEKKANGQAVPNLLRFEQLQDGECITRLNEFQADLFVVFAYGKILPQGILDLPPYKAINLHASLLPELRGAAPIQTAILQGLPRSGWTVQYINQAMDSGDVIMQSEVEIRPNESARELLERMLPSGIELILQSISQIQAGTVKSKPQEDIRASYCKKQHSSSAQICWDLPAQQIHNFVRAHNPSPLAWGLWQNRRLKIHSTLMLTAQEIKSASQHKLWQQAIVGSFGVSPLNSKELWVQCRDQPLSICTLQPENRRKLSSQEFLNGYREKDKLIYLG